MWDGKKVGVIIPAAGSGVRMGSVRPKQFLELGGKPILLHTLERFQWSTAVDAIVLAAPEEFLDDVRALVRRELLPKVLDIVPGGKERRDSVWSGMRRLEGAEIDLVLVHDAVRPFVSAGLIDRVCAAAAEYGAAIPAMPVEQTVKMVDPAGFVLQTPNRSELRTIQTPQGFLFDELLEAYRHPRNTDHGVTDDAMLVERMGRKVRVIEGEATNIKITTPLDLRLATAILARTS
jgi:2-C-methyl-D-erythritol 4-phosphate cytidylyltransferase